MLREYWSSVRETWRTDGKARALAWAFAAGIIVALSVLVAFAS